MDAGTAIAQFHALFDQRFDAVRTLSENGHRVAAHVGGDVPAELLIACGYVPVELCGDPKGDAETGDRLLGAMADGKTRSILHRLLEGANGPLDQLIIGRDSELLVRLFYIIRALRKIEPDQVAAVPERVHFFDLLHGPHRSSGLYNRVRGRALLKLLETWSGRPVAEASLRQAIIQCNVNRRLLQQVTALRRQRPARLTGADALAISSSARFMPREQHSLLVSALLDTASGFPKLDGKRLFMTGSAHDSLDIYRAIEKAGAIIVGEDFDWGDRGSALLVEEGAADPLDAVIDRYHFAPPASAKFSAVARARYTAEQARQAGADAVVCFIYNGDPAPRWDVPLQRDALGSIPLLLIDNQDYGGVDTQSLYDAVTDFIAQFA